MRLVTSEIETKPQVFKDFTRLKDLKPLGNEFLDIFQDSYSEYVTKELNTEITGESGVYSRLLLFLTFIVTSNKKTAISFLDQIQIFGHENATYLHWQFLLDDYREYVIAEKGKEVNGHNYISLLSSFLSYAANRGLCPQDLSIKSFKLLPKPTPSMLTHNRAIPDSVIKEVEDSINAMDLDGENQQVVSMVSSVINNTNREIRTKAELVHAACEFLNDNLKLIRTNAEKELRKVIAQHKLAIRSANKKHNLEAAEEIHKLLIYRDELMAIGYNKCQKQVKQVKKDICSYGVEGLQAYIYHFQGGICPRDAREKHTPQLYHNPELYHYLSQTICKALNVSLIDDINDRFNLHSRAVMLAQCILYIDTCKNETSIRFLKNNCLVENSGAYHLNDQKNRADERKRPIFSVSSDPNEDRIDVLTFSGDEKLKLSIPKVITYLLSATENHRAVAKEHYKNRLFLCLYKNATKDNKGYFPAPLSGGRSTNLFSEVVAELTYGAVKISPYLIRKSSLKLTGLLTKDPLQVHSQAGHTKLSSTKKYLEQLGLSFSHELDIRDFQNAIEALVTMDIEGFVDFAGIDHDDYLASIAKAESILNSHFGGAYCEDPTGGTHTEKGQVCDKVELCPTCPKRRPILLATKNSMMNTMLWNAALELACEKFSKEKMQKWQLWRAFNRHALNVYKNDRTLIVDYRAAERAFKDKANSNPYMKVFNL